MTSSNNVKVFTIKKPTLHPVFGRCCQYLQNPTKHLWLEVHPVRLTWNLQITLLERKMIFQTSMIMFHVNLQGCIRKALTWRLSDWKRGTWQAKKATRFSELSSEFYTGKRNLLSRTGLISNCIAPQSGLDIFSTFSYNDPPFDWILLCWSIQLFLPYHFLRIEDAVKSGIAPTHLKTKNLARQNRKYPITTRKLNVETSHHGCLFVPFSTIMFGIHIQFSILTIPAG